MPRIAYVDGRYLPHRRACVHIEDRGYQFADGVYDVAAVINRRPVDLEPHLARLDRSLDQLAIRRPLGRRALEVVVDQLIRRNRLRHGIIYIQATRGVAPRTHDFPKIAVRPTLVATAKRLDLAGVLARQQRGVAVITAPDQRWARRDIKSVSLLANVIAKQTAAKAGAYEAWLVDGQGQVTEGTSSTSWIVTDGQVVTHPLGQTILAGITRQVVGAITERADVALVERPFTLDEARDAREAFLTSATNMVTPVVRLDDRPVGDGAPGPITRDLIARHWAHVAAETGYRPPE